MAEVFVDATVNGVAIWSYLFTEAGEGIELHVHEFTHQTKVIAGRFKVLGDFWNGLVLTPESEPLQVPVDIEHGFEALEPNSHLLNVADPSHSGVS